MSGAYEVLESVPGIQFVDHVAIAVKQGELEGQVKAYEMMGFREVHREEVWGSDQVREALLQIGEGPNGFHIIDNGPRKGSRGTTVGRQGRHSVA